MYAKVEYREEHVFQSKYSDKDAVSSSSSSSITTCVNSILDQLKCPKHWGAKDWGQSAASGKAHVSHKTRKIGTYI